MTAPKIDLHTHTTCSDGTYTPQELIKHAKDEGIVGLSITDHDTFAAYPEAFSIAKIHGIELISGIELSSLFESESVHVLGYAFDVRDKNLQAACSKQRMLRLERNREILHKLKEYDIVLDEDEITNAKHPTYTYGRVHIAQAMCDKGYVKDIQDAFKQYIGNHKPCYVEGKKWAVGEAIELIHAAHGKAVLAHPHLMSSHMQIQKVLEYPFDGLEAYYGRFFRAEDEKWVQVAQKRGLFVTGGSDFHGAVKPDIRLGCSYTPQEVFDMFKEHMASCYDSPSSADAH